LNMTFICVSVNNFVHCLYGHEWLARGSKARERRWLARGYKMPFSRILFRLNLQFSSKKYIISKIYVDGCLLWLEWESHLHRGNVSSTRFCASGFHLLSCFRETLNRTLRHMGVYLHVFWLFQPPGTPPNPTRVAS